jgi:hypothetical protein
MMTLRVIAALRLVLTRRCVLSLCSFVLSLCSKDASSLSMSVQVDAMVEGVCGRRAPR